VTPARAQRGAKAPATRQTRSTEAQIAAKRGERGRSDLAQGFRKERGK
jgi:hypothetical protein